MGNQVKTVFLLTILTVFIMLIGRILGGVHGMVIALIIAACMNFFSYWYSDKIVLKMYKAQEVSRMTEPRIYQIVERLTNNAKLPMPKIYVIPQEAPNAFATGRDPEHAVVAVTQGLLKIMDTDELAGVLAHELAHVKHRDILIGTIVATMAGAIMLLATMARWSALFGGFGGNDNQNSGGMFGMILMSILAPIAAMLIQMAISRSREYLADSAGASFAQSPEGLAKALEKLGAYSGRIPMKVNPATSHMFIANPLRGNSFANLFSTHPPMAERIAKLRGTRPINSNFTSNETPHQKHTAESDAKNFWDSLK